MRSRLLTACLLGLVSVPAAAQDFDQLSYPGTFVPLADLPNIVGGIQRVSFDSDDNDYVDQLQVGFTFDYLGLDVVTFGVSTNGWIGFNPLTSDSSVNDTFGNQNPKGIIAPWWDDLSLASSSLSASYAVVGTAPHRALVVEMANFSRSPNVNDGGDWQVWLYEKPASAPGDTMGRFEVRVRGSLDNVYDASTGFEGVPGTPNGQFVSCAPNCNATDFASMVDRVQSVLRVSTSELTGRIVDFPRGTLAGQSGTGQVAVTNLGRIRALNVSARVYLSNDNALGPGDTRIGEATIARVDANGADETSNLNFTIPANQTAGDYVLLLAVDEPDDTPESYNLDNTVIGGQRFAVGQDIEPTAVTPAGNANPGDQLTFAVEISERGAPISGPVGVEIFASRDRTIDPTDPQIVATQVTLTNSAVESFDIDATLPALNPGQYYAIARIDTLDAVDEINEFNNTLASASTFATGPDFSIGSVSVPSSVESGQAVTISTELVSTGVPFTGNVRYKLYASSDTSIDASDSDLGLFTVNPQGAASLTDDQSITFDGSVPPGAYHIIAFVDPNTQIAETIETNNLGNSPGRILNASDLRVSNVTIPNEALPGETITVGAEIQTGGVPYSGSVEYRVYLSADLRLDAGDFVVHDGSLNVSGARTPVSAQVTLPETTLVRQWRVIVEVDPNDVVAEAEEANNANTSLDVLNVRGADLAIIEIRGPPFGFIGREYPLELLITNDGVADANGLRVAVFISDNDIVGTADTRIFLSAPMNIAAGQRRSLSEQITIPSLPADQTWHLGAIVDIFSAVPELNELNNSLELPDPIRIAEPSPDLVGAIVDAPTGALG